MTTFKMISRKTNTITQFFTNLLLSNCSLICSSIFSHPLYFSYFIFFSPYFLNLLYFLWPLFVTISLAAFTLSASSAKDEQKGDVDERDDDDDDDDDDVYRFVEAEAYRVLFDCVNYEEVEDDKDDPVEELKFTVFEDVKCSFEEDPVEIITPSSVCTDDNAVLDKSCAQDLAKDIDVYKIDEIANHGADEKEVVESSSDLVKVQNIAQLIKIYESNASNADQCSLGNRENARSFSTKSAGWTKQDDAKLGSYGSMKVLDKEWKRTLACKLYEERNNVVGGGEEGMDSLWETDEPDTSKVMPHPATKKNTKKGGITINENDDDVDGDEEEEIAVQLCCLQALKISSGKMNMGIKKPSLLRFSKALKGLGWLHSASSGSSSSGKIGKKAGRN